MDKVRKLNKWEKSEPQSLMNRKAEATSTINTPSTSRIWFSISSIPLMWVLATTQSGQWLNTHSFCFPFEIHIFHVSKPWQCYAHYLNITSLFALFARWVHWMKNIIQMHVKQFITYIIQMSVPKLAITLILHTRHT